MKYLHKVLQDLSELCEPLSLIRFAESHCTLTWQGGGNIKRRWREGQGRDNYSKEVINQGTAIIWGNTVLWNLRWALSIWWCNIQGPVMHHNADPEKKKKTSRSYTTPILGCKAVYAEHGRLVYWPGTNAEITDYIQRCDICMSLQSNRPKNHFSVTSQHQRPGRKLPLTSSHLMTRIISAQ